MQYHPNAKVRSIRAEDHSSVLVLRAPVSAEPLCLMILRLWSEESVIATLNAADVRQLLDVLTRKEGSATFLAEDGCTLRVLHDNMGEPYREGIELSLACPDGLNLGSVFVESRDVRDLYRALDGILADM